MEGAFIMEEEKTLVTFRVSLARKKQLDFLAEKAGQSITGYLDLLLRGEAENTAIAEGFIDAIETAATKAGIEPKLANALATSTNRTDQLGDIKKLLNDDLYRIFLDEFEIAWYQTVRAHYAKLDLEVPEKFTRGDLFMIHRYVKTY